jgi:nickel-dependent lactate racemase
VYIDERFVSAGLHITLGFIEPHLMLGFSGGRKLIAPGLAAQETIKVLHSPKFMRDARASEGSIEDNPLHRELLEIARLARHDFVVDVALGRGAPGARPIHHTSRERSTAQRGTRRSQRTRTARPHHRTD